MAKNVDTENATDLPADPMAGAHWVTLDANSNVHFDADACLRLRPASTACSACSDACPVAAFTWNEDSVHVASTCVGCGRCEPVCPTHALAVRGFVWGVDGALTTADPVRIECARVPAELRGAAVVVPCLGGVSKEWLLELTAAAAGGQVTLVNRGWCASCKAGGEHFRLSTPVEDAKALLQAVDYPPTGWPRVERCETPVTSALPLSPVWGSQPVNRRRFFATFSDHAVETAKASTHGPIAASERARLSSPTIRAAQDRQLRVLQTLAFRSGTQVPAVIYPEISVSAACDNATICAAACPSGALTTYLDEDGSTGLEYLASLCVACGICEERCPSKAVRMEHTGELGANLDSAPRRLTRFASLRCQECGERYVPKATEPGCPACRIHEALVASISGRIA